MTNVRTLKDYESGPSSTPFPDAWKVKLHFEINSVDIYSIELQHSQRRRTLKDIPLLQMNLDPFEVDKDKDKELVSNFRFG